VRRLAFSNISTICFASSAWRYSRGLRFTSWPSLRIARTSALDKISDRAHVFARESGSGGKYVRIFLHGHGCRGFNDCFASHGSILLSSVLRIAMRPRPCACSVKISSSAAMAVSTCALKNVRRQEAQHRIAGAVDQNLPLQHLGHSKLGQIGRIKLRGQHQAFAAHIDDGAMRAASERNCLLEVVANLGGMSQQTLFLNVRRSRQWPRHRPAARRQTWCRACRDEWRARNLFRAEHGPEGNAAGHRLGQSRNIGLNAVVLIGAPLARAAHAGLNLIDDEQRSGRAG
jgi:hypothetical protein